MDKEINHIEINHLESVDACLSYLMKGCIMVFKFVMFVLFYTISEAAAAKLGMTGDAAWIFVLAATFVSYEAGCCLHKWMTT